MLERCPRLDRRALVAWLALPAAVRKRLGLSAGDQLELELADGGVLLRPARSGVPAEPSPEPVTPAEPSASAIPRRDRCRIRTNTNRTAPRGRTGAPAPRRGDHPVLTGAKGAYDRRLAS